MSHVICQVSCANMLLQVPRCMATGVMFNRPGAVLETSLLLSDWVSQSSYSSEPPKHNYAQTVRDRELNNLKEFSPPTTCNMSFVWCQVSGVRYQVSHVTFFFFFFSSSFFAQSGDASRWRVCYQRVLYHLVFTASALRLIHSSRRYVHGAVCPHCTLSPITPKWFGFKASGQYWKTSRLFGFSSFNFFLCFVICLGFGLCKPSFSA